MGGDECIYTSDSIDFFPRGGDMITIEQLEVLEQIAPHFARVHDMSYEQAILQLVRGYEIDGDKPIKAAERILSLPVTPGITPADVLSPQVQTHPPAHDTETPTVVLDEVIMDDELGPLPSVEELESQPVNDDQPPVVEGDGFDPEDDGSYGWGEGKKGTRWNSAHAALMAELSGLGISRANVKIYEDVASFKDLDAGQLKALALKVTRAVMGLDQFTGAEDLQRLKRVWDSVTDEFGKNWKIFFRAAKDTRKAALEERVEALSKAA